MWKYLRFFSISAVVVTATAALAAGQVGMWVAFALTTFLATGGDALFGDDTDNPSYRSPWILNLQLYGALPLLLLFALVYAWQLSSWDVFGFGAAVQALTGYDAIAARAGNQWWHVLGGALGVGMLFGGVGTVVGHELTHRTWSKPAMIVGRWMLALTSDASFAIEHVYGHHKNVGTKADPATARRGDNAWSFVVRSTVQAYRNAWRIEAARLARRGTSVWSWQNRMHRGNLMTLCYAAFFFYAAGWYGVAVLFATSLYGKAYLEFVNYVEHYGLVRVPGAPVEPRHSWNCNRRMSSYLLFNLTRHSHHHAMGEKPFWELESYEDSPMLPSGYLTMILIAAVPPLWNRVMIPRVKQWDRRFATEAERPYIEAANQESGRAEFTTDYDFASLALQPAAAA